MPVDIDVKVVVDENGKTQITFDKKALMEATLPELINDTSTAVRIYSSPKEGDERDDSRKR